MFSSSGGGKKAPQVSPPPRFVSLFQGSGTDSSWWHQAGDGASRYGLLPSPSIPSVHADLSDSYYCIRQVRVRHAVYDIRRQISRRYCTDHIHSCSSASPFWRAPPRDAPPPKKTRESSLVVGAAYSHADTLTFDSLCAVLITLR